YATAPRPTPFPYTTLVRSHPAKGVGRHLDAGDAPGRFGDDLALGQAVRGNDGFRGEVPVPHVLQQGAVDDLLVQQGVKPVQSVTRLPFHAARSSGKSFRSCP